MERLCAFLHATMTPGCVAHDEFADNEELFDINVVTWCIAPMLGINAKKKPVPVEQETKKKKRVALQDDKEP